MQAPAYRQAKAQATVAWQRQAGNKVLFQPQLAPIQVRVRGLWAYHLDRVPEVNQAMGQAVDGEGHAVDLRRPGVGDDGNAHESPAA